MRGSWLVPAAVLALGWLALGVWYSRTDHRDDPGDYSDTARGSPGYAAEWRDAFDRLADPDEAHARHPEVRSKRFGNGEWVFGVCRDSHTYPDGGTVVVKDSTGRVRAFFGHVCGRGFLAMILEEATSLERFYGSGGWERFGFREYQFP